MDPTPSRPLSPHLTIWRWGPHMLVSILNRVTGAGLVFVGGAAFVWWLYAAASGPEAYASFLDCADESYAIVIWVGLSWALIQHTLTGLRHLVLDTGAGYELRTNKFWSVVTVILALLLTALLWSYILMVQS